MAKDLHKSSVKPSTTWTQNLRDKKEIEDFQQSLVALSRGPVFQRLKEIVESKITSLQTPPEWKEYDCPSWSHKQAHINGELRAYLSLLRLISFDKEQ